jgi:hypothetical protein
MESTQPAISSHFQFAISKKAFSLGMLGVSDKAQLPSPCGSIVEDTTSNIRKAIGGRRRPCSRAHEHDGATLAARVNGSANQPFLERLAQQPIEFRTSMGRLEPFPFRSNRNGAPDSLV